MNWAMEKGAQVISCSWGFFRRAEWPPWYCTGSCPVCRAADECVDKGAVVVVIAGNEGYPKPIGWGYSSIRCPGCAHDVITVGAIHTKNTQKIDDDKRWLHSSRGPTADGRPKPDVMAPGWPGIWSPDPVGESGYCDGDYCNFDMTSAATPHVAGIVALLLQAHPGWTPGIVKRVIMGTARLNDNLIPPEEPGQNPENDRGKGIVDAERAVMCAIDTPTDQADSNHTGGYPPGLYEAEAHLNGTYRVMASGSYLLDTWAMAYLKKSFAPENDMIKPTFFFGFNDTGVLLTWFGTAVFVATLTLWNGTNVLFAHSEMIHHMGGIGGYATHCFHTISHAYDGVLLKGHAYDIEYGFAVSAYAYEPDGNSLADFEVQALSLSMVELLGPGNPSFEKRLMLALGVYEALYWSINNDGWREFIGDIDGDGDVDYDDNLLYCNAYIKYWTAPVGKKDWEPPPGIDPDQLDCDFDGDCDIDIDDTRAFSESYIRYWTIGARNWHGAYSWYTSGGGDYNVTQWLCDFDVNALKGEQITLTFRFYPDLQEVPEGVSARAKILCVTTTGEILFEGDWTNANIADWHEASVTTAQTLPQNTIAIKVIIHGQPNFKAWIDGVSIGIQY